ncbi:CPBP family intramembrane metalloprotease [Bacillus lacus]|uniref:CPBP family intramembrane metalloprotease n=1 Tax=Metabacillus lacus TaxID=1983721 RepID=A0A7X2M0F3_9BACI|nr:type II CAAX endopeptidase family protein [Metabacillus lacus]MRX72769.1 CPBP family intramembrane metalloprotease [Metabacillus lacus]
MRKEYWLIILTYIVMQFSSFVGVPLLLRLGVGEGAARELAPIVAFGYWGIFSFGAALLITLLLLRSDRQYRSHLGGEPASTAASIWWAIAGVFLALFVQVIAANIEINVFGIEPGSENTQQIVRFIQAAPLLIIVTSVIGPILEEIIFRKIIFGVLYEKTNFFIAGLISSVIFALVHQEPEHILLYSAMGFTFAYLYVKTKRILVPIFAHVAMNTFVVLVQIVFADRIDELMEQVEQMQFIFGGFSG